MYLPNSTWSWSFIIISLIQAAIVLGFEAYAFADFQVNLSDGANNDSDQNKSAANSTANSTRTIPTFLTLYIFGLLYQLVLVWDALRLKNTIQVIGLCLYNVGLLIYAAVQMDQIKDAVYQLAKFNESNRDVWTTTKPYLIAIPCILALGTVLLSLVAWKLYDEFAWTIYKHISADLQMKRRYLTFQIYITLLKFDFFFFLGFTIQFVVILLNTKDPEFGLTIAAIPITIVILLMAAVWTRKENRFGMVITIILYFAALAYFVFKLVRVFHGPKTETYKPVRRPLTTFAVITVILIVLTIINAIACMSNFNKGLKPHIATRKVESEEEKTFVTEMPNLSHTAPPRRMSIE